MNSHDPNWDYRQGPLDPYHGDANDPTLLFDQLDPVEPLSVIEQREIAEDLAELVKFRTALTPEGVRGILIDCSDCEEHHYFSWALMAANLANLLATGRTGVHEPAASPDPDCYVTWEYARGFTDAVKSRR